MTFEGSETHETAAHDDLIRATRTFMSTLGGGGAGRWHELRRPARGLEGAHRLLFCMPSSEGGRLGCEDWLGPQAKATADARRGL